MATPTMSGIIKQLPNIITLTNLILGCCAIILLLQGNVEKAALCTIGCFISDYLDGLSARLLKVQSPLGKQLDSLADVVSFGVVPGAALYLLLNLAFHQTPKSNGVYLPALPAFAFTAAAALRLGKFNLDYRQTHYFLGLSTPAATIFILGLTLSTINEQFHINHLTLQPSFLYAVTILLSVLLLTEIPMFGLKFNPNSRKDTGIMLGFLGSTLVLFTFLGTLSFCLIIILYVLFSIAFKNEIYRRN